MANDLKKDNNQSLFLIMAASIIGSAYFQIGIKPLSELAEYAMAGSIGLMLSALLVMLANTLPQSVKHKLVFTRFKNEMPATRVHKLCKNDLRFEYGTLLHKWPEVFAPDISDSTRNSRWYQQIYKPVKDKAEVLQSHKAFLLYRDTFSGLLLILILTSIWAIVGNPAYIGEVKIEVFCIQAILTVFALIAARVAGNRFVVNAVSAAI